MHKDAARRGLFPSPPGPRLRAPGRRLLWFSGWGFPEMEGDCWRFITH
jgi:hypothetical protein